MSKNPDSKELEIKKKKHKGNKQEIQTKTYNLKKQGKIIKSTQTQTLMLKMRF
jgi:hypothetical protein